MSIILVDGIKTAPPRFATEDEFEA
jgi:hypothetical protein